MSNHTDLSQNIPPKNHRHKRIAFVAAQPGYVPKHKRKPIEERFFSKVQKTENCWIWIGERHSFGYGRIVEIDQNERTIFLAHRVSWEIHFGPIPENMHVLHRCDNPPCVNPDHLFLGTQADNNHDKTKKGRQSKGEQRPHSKLTTNAVLEIRQRYANGGISQQALADKFGVSNGVICTVINKKAWKHVSSFGEGLM